VLVPCPSAERESGDALQLGETRDAEIVEAGSCGGVARGVEVPVARSAFWYLKSIDLVPVFCGRGVESRYIVDTGSQDFIASQPIRVVIRSARSWLL